MDSNEIYIYNDFSHSLFLARQMQNIVAQQERKENHTGHSHLVSLCICECLCALAVTIACILSN